MKNKFRILGLLIFFTAFACTDDDRVVFVDGDVAGNEPSNPGFADAKQVVLNMGAGFNLGNTFDNGINSTEFAAVKPIIDLYKNAGMKTRKDSYNMDGPILKVILLMQTET